MLLCILTNFSKFILRLIRRPILRSLMELCGLMIDAASLLAHNGVALLGWLGLNIGGML